MNDQADYIRQLERERENWKALATHYSADREHNAIVALAYKAERDEARKQLAEIENRMRSELGGHPNSELWGEAGLIAATMRCVDALGEVTDQRDEARADAIRWQSVAETISNQ